MRKWTGAKHRRKTKLLSDKHRKKRLRREQRIFRMQGKLIAARRRWYAGSGKVFDRRRTVSDDPIGDYIALLAEEASHRRHHAPQEI